MNHELEDELRLAIEADQLTLMLQPLGCLAGGHVVGAEALLRWQHPERGTIEPLHFLPLAQACGLMPSIDRWVFEGAVQLLVALKSYGLTVPVSINVSAQTLADTGWIGGVHTTLKKFALEPALLEIEIPECHLSRHAAASAHGLATLNALGVGISIDDFGAGATSLAHLTRFYAQTLKIDSSFIADLCVSPNSRTLVHGLIALAHALGLRVVAEGAETGRQIEALHRMQCDRVQGFAYCAPVPLAQFCAFAKAHGAPSGPDPFSI